MKYLLDTNTCIYYLKGFFQIKDKINQVGFEHCAISEITIAELKFGIEKGSEEKREKNIAGLQSLENALTIIPIISCFDVYAKEKVRLQKSGQIIDDFDLLIGSTAIASELILVTNNITHFERLENIKLENWVKK